MPCQRSSASSTQTCSAFLHDAAIHLRHARGGRAGAWAEGEGVDVSEIAFVNEREQVCERLVALGRETRDEVCAERDFRARSFQLLAKLNRLRARVAAFHALEDQIVAMLQRKVQIG